MTDLVPSPAPDWDNPGDCDDWARGRRSAGVSFQEVAATLDTSETVLPGTAARIQESIPANTDRAYRQAWGQFDQWCQDSQRTPLPTNGVVLADYVAHLCDRDLAPATIAQAMAVISSWNQGAGYPALAKDTTKAARLILSGHRRNRAKAGRRPEKAPPVTGARLRQLTGDGCDRTTLAGKRDRLLLVIGYALAGRRSELVALQIEDVVLGDGDLNVLIRASKTDQNAEGVWVNVPAGEHVDTDPVGLLRDWVGALAERGVDTTTGPLFRAVTQHDRLYQHTGITTKSLNEIVKRAALRAGLPNASTYSAHSLRSGFATEASESQVPLGIWAVHGRWSPTSPVPNGYVRAADARLNNPLRRMGL